MKKTIRIIATLLFITILPAVAIAGDYSQQNQRNAPTYNYRQHSKENYQRAQRNYSNNPTNQNYQIMQQRQQIYQTREKQYQNNNWDPYGSK